MGSIASELKSEREKRKISLAQIAADTRISLRHLESLEEGRYSDLPGGMYNRAFLRAYCESLNLDQREMMRRYEAEVTPFTEKPPKSKVHFPEESVSLKPSPVILWSLALLISVTGLFFSRKWIAEVFRPWFAHTQATTEQIEHSSQPAVSSSAAPSSPIRSTSRQPSVQPVSVAGESSVPSVEFPVSPGTPIQSAPPSAAPESRAQTSISTHSLRLDVAVTEKCWISIDRDGSPAFRKLLQPGESQSLSAAEKFFLIVGNAGAVHLKINGRPAKPIGLPGQVIRLLIDEKRLPDLIDHTAG